MLLSPERPRRRRDIVVLALLLSLLVHILGGGFAALFGHRIAEVVARVLPHPTPTPELEAMSDAITIERRTVPREVHRAVAPPPPRAAQRPAAAQVPLPVPTLAPLPTTQPTTVPTYRPVHGTIHHARPAPTAQPRREIAQRAATAATQRTTESATHPNQLSAQQIAMLEGQFSRTISQAQQQLSDTPRQSRPPSTMKHYSMIMSGKPSDVLDAQGICTDDEPPQYSRGYVYHYYRCNIQYSDGYAETVTFPWPFRFLRKDDPRPGQSFAKQGPPEGFVLPHPFGLSRAVCSFYQSECAAVIAREKANGAPDYGAP